jgi:Putative Actinobacterial Holin-X, holin superfamily III
LTDIHEERSFPQLFGDSLSQLTKLVQNEIDLARAELFEKVSLTTSATKFAAAGVVLVIPAVVLLLLAMAAELAALGLGAPLAYLCSGGGAAIIAGGLVWVGLSRLSGGALRPSATFDEFKRNKAKAAELIR